MKVLFTHSYFLRFDEKQWKQRKPYPPLATIQAAAVLRENGHEVALFDTNFVEDPKQLTKTLDTFQPEVLVIYDDGFNYLTKMCLTRMREAAFEMIKLSKSKNLNVFVSSSDSTDHFESYLNNGADAVILGEADETLRLLIRSIADKEPYTNTAGIAFLQDGKSQQNQKRPVLTDLSDLPLPAWDLIDITLYQNAWSIHGYFSINIATTRGCPYKCNWCAKPIYGNRYNSRSPQHVVNEIKLIKTYFDFDHIWFCDDIFGLKPKWVQEFNEILTNENIKISYKIQSRADLLLKDDTIKSLANSGCDEVWIGAESGSQKVLDAMDKGTSIQQIKDSTALMKKHGIKPCFFLQFGYLGEEWEDIEATLDMLFTLMPHDIGVSVSYPLPGTKFYDIVKSELSEKTNWTDSDELLMMYKGTYSPEFYKKLHRYLHKRFREKQLLIKIRNGGLLSLPRMLYYKVLAQLFYQQVILLKQK